MPPPSTPTPMEEHALCSRAGAPGPTPLPPPPPPLRLSRPERLEGFVARPAGGTTRRSSRGHQRRSPSPPVPPPPSLLLGSARPEVEAAVRLESTADDARRGGRARRSGSPGPGMDRRRHHRSTTRRSPLLPVPLPPPPALGSSRPDPGLADVVRRESDGDRDATRRRNARRSGSSPGARGDRRQRRSTTRRSPSPPLPLPAPAPHPPPLESSRPELAAVVRRESDGDHDASRRGSARRSDSPGAGGGQRQRCSKTQRSPSPPLPLPPPPPPRLGSSRRPELAAVGRLESDDDARRGGSRKRSDSPRARAEGGRHRERRSPPRRSPSPVPRKRSRRGSSRNESGRNEGRGNHTGSRSCSPDRPYSGYGAATIGHDKTGRLGLMTYKQFIQVLEDDVSPAQAGCRYQEYRTEYINTQKRAYFDLNQNEDWLKDMYHPTKLLSVIRRRNDFCKTVARNLILDLRNGTLDLGPGVTADAAIKSEGNDGSSEDNADYGENKRKHGRGPQKEIEPLSAAPKAHPISSQHRRICTDIHQTLALVEKLDSEKDIMENILLTGDHGKSNLDKSYVRSISPVVTIRGLNTVKRLEGVKLLDTLLTYLWRVHGVDYYGMSEMKHAKGFRHVRAENKIESMAENISAADWEKKLDSFWKERLMNGQDPLVVLTAMDKIEAALVEVLEHYVRKMRDEKCVWKYGCGAKGCEKLFHAPEYVHKHLNLKHPDLVSTLASRVENDIYFQNYMNDPDAPGGKPLMQQTVPDRMTQRLDEQMFGASGVWGSHAPLLPMCAPSLVLVPVPGAGPYGPFVPAPPEIAMQMIQKGLRGPDSAQHRKPSMLGPMLPMYPSFPLGSRIYRSYEDLDAPMEEVSPLDFRSL